MNQHLQGPNVAVIILLGVSGYLAYKNFLCCKCKKKSKKLKRSRASLGSVKKASRFSSRVRRATTVPMRMYRGKLKAEDWVAEQTKLKSLR